MPAEPAEEQRGSMRRAAEEARRAAEEARRAAEEARRAAEEARRAAEEECMETSVSEIAVRMIEY